MDGFIADSCPPPFVFLSRRCFITRAYPIRSHQGSFAHLWKCHLFPISGYTYPICWLLDCPLRSGPFQTQGLKSSIDFMPDSNLMILYPTRTLTLSLFLSFFNSLSLSLSSTQHLLTLSNLSINHRSHISIGLIALQSASYR